MKEGWEYKKLGEVCNIYQPKTLSSKELVEDGKYLVYGANGVIGKYNSYNHESSEVLMTCRGATCGTINVSKPYSWINGNAMVVHPQHNILSQNFLFYLLKGLDLSDVITGAAQPQITRPSLAPKKIAIPPLSEQRHIVEELDLLSSTIEKKKAQIKELDNLAQSLFYEMFGDPISNEKGWEIGKISNFINVKGGFAFKSQRYTTKGIRLVQIANVWKDSLSWDDITYISEEDAKTNSSFLLKQGDIVMAMTRPIIQSLEAVKVAIVNEHDIPSILNQRVCKFEIRDSIDNIWLYQFLRLPYFKYKIKEFSSKGMQPNVSSREIESIQIFVPPFSLQQQFASKIEAIEHQKELIKQSIKEVETLFNSRMDYYFN